MAEVRAPVEQITLADRAANGKAARADVPRSVLATWEPSADGPDPVDLLEEQAESRVPELVPIRHGRMLVSPFTFYRGAAYLMASDLSRAPRTGQVVQLCGDAHLSNVGVFAAPDRRLVFSIDDFDETHARPVRMGRQTAGHQLPTRGCAAGRWPGLTRAQGMRQRSPATWAATTGSTTRLRASPSGTPTRTRTTTRRSERPSTPDGSEPKWGSSDPPPHGRDGLGVDGLTPTRIGGKSTSTVPPRAHWRLRSAARVLQTDERAAHVEAPARGRRGIGAKSYGSTSECRRPSVARPRRTRCASSVPIPIALVLAERASARFRPTHTRRRQHRLTTYPTATETTRGIPEAEASPGACRRRGRPRTRDARRAPSLIHQSAQPYPDASLRRRAGTPLPSMAPTCRPRDRTGRTPPVRSPSSWGCCTSRPLMCLPHPSWSATVEWDGTDLCARASSWPLSVGWSTSVASWLAVPDSRQHV
jgi:hypothetical protein